MNKPLNERDDLRPVVGEERYEYTNTSRGKHTFPKPTLLSTLFTEFLGCMIGSFLGTVIVKFLTQLL